jgi:hypothetical protein
MSRRAAVVCPTAPRLPRAYILAGGLGLRLRSVVADRPKALAEVGGRPFLDFVIGQIDAHGGMAITLSAFNPRDVLAWHVDPDDAPQEPAAEPKHAGDRRKALYSPVPGRGIAEALLKTGTRTDDAVPLEGSDRTSVAEVACREDQRHSRQRRRESG